MNKTMALLLFFLLLGHAAYAQKNKRPANAKPELKIVRLHMDGFSKSKSGAVWMAWPETVKQALEELAAVKKIEMLLDRDEFLVTFDPAKADTKLLLRTVTKSGFTARVVFGQTKSVAPVITALPSGFPLLDEALAQAKAENKPIVLDLHAEWCAPCQKLERLTFPDARVKALLAQTVFLRIDTDQHPDIAQRLGVAGLPDIRLVLPDGTIIRQLRSFQDAKTFAVELEQLLQQVVRK